MLLLRVPLQGVGLGTGVALQALGPAARLADDLVGLGTGLGDRLVGGLLGEREHAGGAVAAGALLLHRAAHGAAHLLRAAHGATHLLHLLLAHALAHRVAHRLRATGAAHGLQHLTAHRLDQLLLAAHGLVHLLLRAAGRELRGGAGGQAEGLVAHLLLRAAVAHLLLRTARAHLLRTTGAHLLRAARALLAGDRRAGYGGRNRGAALAGGVLLRFLAQVGLVLRGGTSRGGQLGAQVLVLPEEAGQLRLDLVEEGIDLVLVIAFTQADGRELLVPNVLGGQWHLFTST